MGVWYEQTAFYHIYPLGLCGAEKENRVAEVQHRFDEITGWLPHIRELGCKGVYIGPLFESTTHGYDTRDYRMVDRRLGDTQDFQKFVRTAHELDIKVVVDGVFNHTGREFFAFQDIQKNREGSRYCSWYKGINFGWNNPYNDGFGYEAWRNCFELVNLNLQNPEVKDYLFDVIRYWIDTFDIDGIRLDCADCLDFGFLKDMRRMTDGIKPEFWLMGEVIHGDYARWANPEMCHSVTNYELHKGLYSGHNDHNYFEIAHTIRRQFDANGGIYRGRTLYSFVDNHDVDRLVNKLNDKRHLYSVYALLYTLPGVPSVYYGSEWGVSGRKENHCDDGLRPRLVLADCEANPPEKGLAEWISFLGKAREEYPVIGEGAYRELLLTNWQYAFARISGQEGMVTAVNNDEEQAELIIPMPFGVQSAVDIKSGETLAVRDNRLMAAVGPGEGKLIHIKG